MKTGLNILYPRQCLGCGRSDPKPFQYICWDCWSDTLKVEPPFCDCCGDPVSGSIEHRFICYACSSNNPAFKKARSATRYDGVIGEALRKLKYEAAFWLSPDLSQLMFQCVQVEYPDATFDLILPVPLYRVRYRERGYNQSEILAKELSRAMNLPFSKNILRRIKPTISQTNLTAKERLSNVVGAFKCKKEKRLKDQHILLVDDVMTTGATVDACAKALKRGGVASVSVITVARG